MSAPTTSAPSLRDIAAALASGNARAQQAAFDIRPPDKVDPNDVKAVMDAVRAAEAAQRGGVDIKT